MKKNSAHSLFLLFAIFILPAVNNFLISQDVKEGLQSYESVFAKLDFRQIKPGRIFHIDKKNNVKFLINQGFKQNKWWKKHNQNKQVYYFENTTSSLKIDKDKAELRFIMRTNDNSTNPNDLFAIIKLHVRKGNRLFQKRPRRCIYKHGILGLKSHGPYPNFVNTTLENVEYINFNAINYLKNAYIITINSSDLPAGEYCIQNGESMEYQLFTIK